MTCAVIIPAYLLESDPARQRGYELVRRHLDGLLERTDWRLVLGFGQNAARARNNGARIGDSEVLVFNDADTLVPYEQVEAAARLAAEAPGLVYAFREYRRLAENQSAAFTAAEEAFALVPAESYPEPPSHGCVAIRRACFEEAGGYDPRLEAFEDCAFARRCEERWPSRRVDGAAVHLWHPRLGDAGWPAWEERFAASREIWEREYLRAGA